MGNAIRKYASLIRLSRAVIDRGAVKRLSTEFWEEFVKMSHRLGAKPEDIAIIIMSESAFDPSALNMQGGRPVAKGLNQFTKKSLPGIGMSLSEWNTMENMPAIDQLEFIERYYKVAGERAGVEGWDSATQLYVANFAPVYLSKAGDPNAVLYEKSQGKAYTQNKGLDREEKGYITVGDLSKSVNLGLPKYVRDSISAAKGEGPSETSGVGEFDTLVNTLIGSNGKLTKMVKNSILKEKLPVSDVLICVRGESYYNKLEYARVAAGILRRFIDADAFVRGNDSEVEIQCSAIGREKTLTGAVEELCGIVLIGMNKHVESGVSILVLPTMLSRYGFIEDGALIKNRRRFNMNRVLHG